MILYSIVLFCLAAALGLSIVVLGLRYKRGSLTLALGHAAVAVLALGLLMNQILGDGPSHILYNTAALLFFLTLFGGLVLLAELVWVSMGIGARVAAVSDTFGSVPEVARLLYGKFVYPFELTSILLLIAVVGAVVLAKKGL